MQLCSRVYRWICNTHRQKIITLDIFISIYFSKHTFVSCKNCLYGISWYIIRTKINQPSTFTLFSNCSLMWPNTYCKMCILWFIYHVPNLYKKSSCFLLTFWFILGSYCDTKINFCSDYNPCHNGAECVDMTNDYRYKYLTISRRVIILKTFIRSIFLDLLDTTSSILLPHTGYVLITVIK